MFDNLGDTADKVAQALKSLGIRGVRHAVYVMHPIVRYAKTQLTGSPDLNVIRVKTLRIVYPDGQLQIIQMPDAVVAFLDAFNNGAYPDLESPY